MAPDQISPWRRWSEAEDCSRVDLPQSAQGRKVFPKNAHADSIVRQQLTNREL